MEVIDKGNSSQKEKSQEQKLQDELFLSEMQRRQSRNKIFGGVLLIGFGVILLARKLGVYFPHWIISWPVALMVVGIFLGAKDSFQKTGWIIVTFIGFMFFMRDILPDYDLMQYMWPIGLIVVGMFIILKPGTLMRQRTTNWNAITDENTMAGNANNVSGEDYIESNSVFGSMKRSISSKSFKGGEVNCVFGGGELNLSQADFQGVARLELNAIFGGIRLIVPSAWEVKSELTAVFGGAEDKRIINPNAIRSSDKLLILEGNAVFGGIEIHSFN